MSDVTQTEVSAEALAPVPLPKPQIDPQGRTYATGKRKDAVARVWIKPGSGQFECNGRTAERYFARPVLRMILGQPFVIADRRRPVRHSMHGQGGRALGPGRRRAARHFEGADAA